MNLSFTCGNLRASLNKSDNLANITDFSHNYNEKTNKYMVQKNI